MLLGGNMSDSLVRLGVNLNQETADALRAYAGAHRISITEAVRRCVAITVFVDQEVREGRRVITERQDGTKRREMVMM